MSDFGAQRHELIENFRCARVVVDAANALVQNQPGRFPKPEMAPATPAPGSIAAFSCSDEKAEAQLVATWVKELLEKGLNPEILYPSESPAIRAEDICILCRNRYSLDSVISVLEEHGIEHLFSAGRGLVETIEARLVLQGLKILQNPFDRVTMEAILAAWAPSLLSVPTPPREAATFFAQLAHASTAAAPFASILQGSYDVSTTVRALSSLIEELSTEARATNEQHALALSVDASTLRERWRQYAGHTSPHDRSIGGFLAEVSLAGKSVIEGPGVRVLTVHVAKGLEFKAVALVGMNEGTLPDYRSRTAEDLADERRVAYVAITRASRHLLLTRPRSRVMPWGDSQVQRASRFLRDMSVVMVDV